MPLQVSADSVCFCWGFAEAKHYRLLVCLPRNSSAPNWNAVSATRRRDICIPRRLQHFILSCGAVVEVLVFGNQWNLYLSSQKSPSKSVWQGDGVDCVQETGQVGSSWIKLDQVRCLVLDESQCFPSCWVYRYIDVHADEFIATSIGVFVFVWHFDGLCDLLACTAALELTCVLTLVLY